MIVNCSCSSHGSCHPPTRYIQPAFEKNTVHFIGLLSDGGVHSRYDQLLMCLQGGAVIA